MKKKRLTCFALAMILCACTCTPAFATEQVEQGEPEEIIIPIHNNAEVREIEVSLDLFRIEQLKVWLKTVRDPADIKRQLLQMDKGQRELLDILSRE